MYIHQQLNFLFGWCVVILTIFQLNMFCNVEVLRFLLELQYTCSNNFFYLPLCVGDIETNIHFLLLFLWTVSILRTCGSLKVPRRILESDSLKILDALQNMVVEEGNIATLIMWNLWCTMNKFVFEETMWLILQLIRSFPSSISHDEHLVTPSLLETGWQQYFDTKC